MAHRTHIQAKALCPTKQVAAVLGTRWNDTLLPPVRFRMEGRRVFPVGREAHQHVPVAAHSHIKLAPAQGTAGAVPLQHTALLTNFPCGDGDNYLPHHIHTG